MKPATNSMHLAATGLQHRGDPRAVLCENLFADFRGEKSRDEPIVDVDQRGRQRSRRIAPSEHTHCVHIGAHIELQSSIAARRGNLEQACFLQVGNGRFGQLREAVRLSCAFAKCVTKGGGLCYHIRLRRHLGRVRMLFNEDCHLSLNILYCQSDENDDMTSVTLSTASKEKIMTLTDNVSVVFECTRLANRFCCLADRSDAAGVANLFTADGTLARGSPR